MQLPMSERVLVTGGAGFVGRRVVSQLCERGHDPVVFDRPGAVAGADPPEEVPVVSGDVTDPTEVARAVSHHDVSRIVHLAAVLTAGAADPRALTEVNVLGTNNVLEAARTFDDRVERVVYASSETVYAPQSAYEGDRVAESAPLSPETLYAGSKVYAERQAAAYREGFGVDAVGLRPTLVYGPDAGDDAGFIAELVEGAVAGESVAVENGDQVVSWLHVDDAARAFVDAALADADALEQSVYNLRGDLATVREAAGVVADLTNADVTVADGAEEWSSQRLDDAAIRRDLGFEPTYDLADGLAAYVDAVR
jgi:nucleoside-diphosphate-sugar epimerase